MVSNPPGFLGNRYRLAEFNPHYYSVETEPVEQLSGVPSFTHSSVCPFVVFIRVCGSASVRASVGSSDHVSKRFLVNLTNRQSLHAFLIVSVNL
jgi:hypothetical protein